MPDCRLCPRQCGADRAVSAGVCHMGSAVRVARAAPHYGEEPCISGERGSGAVFFAGCPLGCVYCQNYALSRGRIGETVSVERLAAIFAGLEAKGVHNLNLVTGTQFTPEIREALTIAKPKIPVVWNTSGYETVDTVDRLLGAKLRGDVSPEGLQRAQGYLLRRGYSWDDIRAATERYLSGKDTP